MKCPKCEGTGEIQICEMGFIGKDECDECHGKGYLNNEEWFCQLPTEEKAAFLANYFMFDCPMVDKVFQKQEAHNFIGLEKLAKETILEWLKEKHYGNT